MKYKMVCFDLDGTIVDDIVFVWQAIHDHLRTDSGKRSDAYARFREGKLTYQQWADHDLSLWKKAGAKRRDLLSAISGAKLVPGAMETLRILKRRGYKLAIISGSIDILLEKLIPEYQELFDDIFINRIKFDDDGSIKECIATPFDMQHKATALRMLCRREGLSQSQCVFVGDNHNDVHIAECAGLSIAFNCKSPELAKVSDIVVKKKDLREILLHLE